MAALAMSGAPPPLPSRAGRPDPPSVSTLPRRGPTSASRPQSAQSPRNRRGSSDDLPPPPPRNRHDPLPPVPPSTANIPIPQVNQRPSSSTLPRNSRSESNLQSHDAPPRLPPRRGTSFHGPHSSNVRPNLTNGAIPAPIQESQGTYVRIHFRNEFIFENSRKHELYDASRRHAAWEIFRFVQKRSFTS
ncbi:WAS/WASL-interacting protein family member 1-like [Saccostrea cucullata]|uniref:WAS/WASL-interacting protein family member 1-like n=1 Tax=Saccostrea cuccullata TaxID=36930 RepID=UPI002ED1E17A